MNLVIGWQTKLAILAFVFFSAFTWHKAQVQIAVERTIAEANERNLKDIIRLTKKASEVSNDLKNKVEVIQKEKNAEIKDTNRKYNALLNSLSYRTDRSSKGSNPGNPPDAKSEEGVTGVRLYRSDAEFLARFARDTAELQIELNSCYKQYDSVKESIDKFRKDNNPSEKP